VKVSRKKLHFVAVTEADPNHDDLAQCQALGAITLIGSSTDVWQLKKALVKHAQVLLALFGQDDRLNVETAVLASEMSQGPRTGSLTCVLQIADVDLGAIVRKHAMAAKHNLLATVEDIMTHRMR
jgi:TrkA-N domain